MSNTNITTTTETTTVVVEENIVRIELNNIGVQGVPGANNDPVYVTVRNATGSLITKGSIVYVSGGNGTHTQVTKALATSDATSARVLGWLADDIANNADGLCMVEGYLDGVDTQGVTEGAQLYLSGTTAGAYQVTKPVAPIHLVYVGVAVKASAGNGRVYVKVQNGYELNELHDVLITAPTNNQVLAYDSATSLWKNATNAPDGVTSITAVSPLTGGTITSTGSIGLDQTALSITKSQVSDFTSGTVTSAGTAQQAGTAVYAVNSGTAVYATTSGTAVYSANSGTAVTISGSITKSQVSDFTSGTVAQADNATNAGTSVYATNSGTAVFATTSGTATYATNAGTAVFATTSGTATFATNSGTAVFATNASTAVSVSGSAITQSQVVNLVSDLAGKANLAGGNAFTGTQTVTSSAIGQIPVTITGATGQTGNLFSVRSDVSELAFFSAAGNLNVFQQVRVGGSSGLGQLSVTSINAANIGAVIRGASGQSANLFEIQSSAGTILSRFSSSGQFVSDQQTFVGAGAPSISNSRLNVATGSSSVIGLTVRGASAQTADLFLLQNNGGTTQFRVDPNGMTIANSLGVAGSPSGISYAYFTTPVAGAVPVVIRGAASQTASVLALQNSAGSITANFTAPVNNVNRLNLGGTDLSATFGITVHASGGVGQVIRAAASQSANLFEAQTSAGVVRTYINSIGDMSTGSLGLGYATPYSGVSNSILGILTAGAANIGIAVRGSVSQTANLQQWQISDSTVVARVLADGQFVSSAINTSNNFARMLEANSGGTLQLTRMTAQAGNAGANIGRIYLRDGTNAGTLKLVIRAGAAGAETTILDNIPQ